MWQASTSKIQNDAKIMHTKLVYPSLYSFFKVKKDGEVGVLVLCVMLKFAASYIAKAQGYHTQMQHKIWKSLRHNAKDNHPIGWDIKARRPTLLFLFRIGLLFWIFHLFFSKVKNKDYPLNILLKSKKPTTQSLKDIKQVTLILHIFLRVIIIDIICLKLHTNCTCVPIWYKHFLIVCLVLN